MSVRAQRYVDCRQIEDKNKHKIGKAKQTHPNATIEHGMFIWQSRKRNGKTKCDKRAKYKCMITLYNGGQFKPKPKPWQVKSLNTLLIADNLDNSIDIYNTYRREKCQENSVQEVSSSKTIGIHSKLLICLLHWPIWMTKLISGIRLNCLQSVCSYHECFESKTLGPKYKHHDLHKHTCFLCWNSLPEGKFWAETEIFHWNLSVQIVHSVTTHIYIVNTLR